MYEELDRNVWQLAFQLKKEKLDLGYSCGEAWGGVECHGVALN
jgi:hypothetical protein